MAGGGKDQQTEADTVLLIKSLQKITASTYEAETTTREEIEAKHWHYQNDSYFQRRVLYLEKEICDAQKRTKSLAALLQPIREEQEEGFIFSSSSFRNHFGLKQFPRVMEVRRKTE